MQTIKSMNPNDTIHPNRSRWAASMAVVISILTLFACISGIFVDSIYGDLIANGRLNDFLHFGSIAQDIIFIPLAVLTIVLAVVFLRGRDVRILVTVIGFVCNFFYGYGLYVMQGQYTAIYMVYLVIFGLSVYCIIYGLLSFKPEFVQTLSIRNSYRKAIGIYLILIPSMLGLIWMIRLISDISMRFPGDTYAVFVLDLGIVFPAFAITAIGLFRKNPYAVILAGVVLVKIFTVCLSWGFSELYGRIDGILVGDYGLLAIPGVLTLSSILFFVLYLKGLTVSER